MSLFQTKKIQSILVLIIVLAGILWIFQDNFFKVYALKKSNDQMQNIDDDNKAISLVEKPSNPKSNYAVSGLYFYPNDVVEIAKNQKPSDRNELEITDTNRVYLSQKRLKVEKLGRGCAWLDTGTHDSLLEASQFVQILEKRQGVKISCIEEIAFRMGYIDRDALLGIGKKVKNNPYGDYLIAVAEEN